MEKFRGLEGVSGKAVTELSQNASFQTICRAFYEDNPCMCFVVGANHRVLSTNPFGAKQLGYSAEELVGHSVLEVFHPEDACAVHQQLADCVQNLGVRGSWEVRKVRKDGSVLWVRETARAISGPEGPPLILIVCEDITERKTADQSLLALRDELERLIVDRTGELRWKTAFLEAETNSTLDGILVIDPEGDKIYLNRQLIAMFKIPRHIAEEKREENQLRWTATRVKNPNQFLQKIKWLNDHPKEVSREEIELINGTIIDRFSGPVIDEQGHYYGRIWTFRDITQLKLAERKAEEALAFAEEALKKEVVLRREMHHRVKNNLQVIISLLYLQSQKIADPNTRKLFEESQLRVRSIALVHEMLSQRENLTEICFGEYVRHLAMDLFTTFHVSQRKVTLIIRNQEVYLGLNSAIPCGIIITELLTNALKYAFPGERAGEIEISLDASASKGGLVMKVRDNGVGIPAEVDVNSGQTMGLNLVRDLTAQLGGKVEFHTPETGRGTLVQVTFPV